MAGDWIKMRTDLAYDPAVIGIALATGLEADAVVGKLHRLWSWADRHTCDGNARCVTEKWIDSFLNVTSFAQAMVTVGWLVLSEGSISFPNFDHHNGQTAKQRALTLKRVRNARTVTEALPEKRREEKSILTSTSEEGAGPAVDVDAIKNFDFRGEEFLAAARKIAQRVPAAKPADRSLIAKAICLGYTVMSQHWLWDSVAACEGKPPPKRAAYFHGVLRSKTAERGMNFNRLLKLVDVPADVLERRSPAVTTGT